MTDLFTLKKYATNCFLLTIPILVWNLVFVNKLPPILQPEEFWSNIPGFLRYGENFSRVFIFALTLVMPLSIITPKQQNGLALYIGGTLLYFLTWLVLIYFPNSRWSNSLIGYVALSFTPLIWLIGIGKIGDSFFFNFRFGRLILNFFVFVFLLLHNFHTMIIFNRNFLDELSISPL